MTDRQLKPLPLPNGVIESYVDCSTTCGLKFHILEAGYTEARDRPLILLHHGYPELAFSWRKVMLPLAEAGCYVVAVDHRGYGRTTGWDMRSFEQTDISSFSMTTIVRDNVALINALGYKSVHCIVGHDFGGVSSTMCALMRPDLFKSIVIMSHPFKGSPAMPFNTRRGEEQQKEKKPDLHEELARLPEPRKHYKWYNSTKPAASDWLNPDQGMEAFLRGYLHVKSADFKGNDPHPLRSFTASELVQVPFYYIMPMDKSMPEAVALMMKNEDANLTKRWMSDEDLAVYVEEWSRTGFQGGLNWYRCTTDPENMRDVLLFAGKQIEVPSTFISGAKDWGNFQEPGCLERFSETCSQFKGVKIIDGAGHWPQQEQPEQVVKEILSFLTRL